MVQPFFEAGIARYGYKAVGQPAHLSAVEYDFQATEFYCRGSNDRAGGHECTFGCQSIEC
ncbi:hypothetical protein D3C87_1858970 [compost metagenome]